MLQHNGHGCGRTADQSRHRAIGFVADPTRQTESLRLPPHPKPESDTLDTTGYANQYRFGVIRHDGLHKFQSQQSGAGIEEYKRVFLCGVPLLLEGSPWIHRAPDTMATMEIDMDTVEINGRSDFALWAIQRAQEIVMAEGAALALAARDMNEEALQENGAALGKAIADAMLEVFDGLMAE